jgi:iron(III) transport system substrate-binding protein
MEFYLPMRLKVLVATCSLALVPLLSSAAVSGEVDGWKTEWEKTVQAAKREGQVMFYTDPEHEAMFEGFKKKYPEIKVRFVGSESVDLGPRLLAEIRARKYIADIYKSGLTTQIRLLYKNGVLAPIKPVLILPEVVDESKWYKGKHLYGDPEGQFVFVFEMSVRDSGVAYNTKLLNPREIQSYWDLLNPKWRGKIVSLDPKARGPISNSLRYFYYNPQLGPDFIRRLFSETEVTLARDDRQMMDWLASGKFLLYVAPRGTDVARAQGLPVDFLPRPKKEMPAVDLGQSTISLLKTAPHPNAAKIALNWFFSREGQLAFQNFSQGRPGLGGNSAREDIPKHMVNPIKRREKGMDYFFVSDPRHMDMDAIYRVVDGALAKAKKE